MATHSVPHSCCCTLCLIAIAALLKIVTQVTAVICNVGVIASLEIADAANRVLEAAATSNNAIATGHPCIGRIAFDAASSGC